MDEGDEQAGCKCSKDSKHDFQGNLTLFFDGQNSDLWVDLWVGESDSKNVFDCINLGILQFSLCRVCWIKCCIIVSVSFVLSSIVCIKIGTWRWGSSKLLPWRDDLLLNTWGHLWGGRLWHWFNNLILPLNWLFYWFLSWLMNWLLNWLLSWLLCWYMRQWNCFSRFD